MRANLGVVTDLNWRGLVVQSTVAEELEVHLSGASRTVYCGFDPTADSLHIGHLVPLLALRRFQLAGHRPIALIGGATGLVGDPSFKATERGLNAAEAVMGWTESIQSQVQSLLDPSGSSGAIIVNNLDWFREFRLLDFLREVGKHFSVNAMIRKESVKQRIEREGEGISFAEFSYMMLQAYDFSELNRRLGCSMQIGGSDQWGNITAGIDLCWRQNRAQVHALTFPLVTKADGTKFGKTEGGTVWLDPERTSPYSFYQFWLNTSDADAYRFLRYFTFLSEQEIGAIEKNDAESGAKPTAQVILAREVTRLVHGEAGLESALRITGALFSERLGSLSDSDFEQLKLDGLPYSRLQAVDLEKPLTGLLTEVGIVQSGKQAKDALARDAVLINGTVCRSEDNQATRAQFAKDRALHGRFFLARVGKKKHHLFEFKG